MPHLYSCSSLVSSTRGAFPLPFTCRLHWSGEAHLHLAAPHIGEPSWEVGSDSVPDRVSYSPLYPVYSCHSGPHLQLTCGYLLKCPPPTLLLFPKGTGLCESPLWVQHTASSHLGTLRAQVVVMCVHVTILPDDYPSRSHSPLCTSHPHPVL